MSDQAARFVEIASESHHVALGCSTSIQCRVRGPKIIDDFVVDVDSMCLFRVDLDHRLSPLVDHMATRWSSDERLRHVRQSLTDQLNQDFDK